MATITNRSEKFQFLERKHDGGDWRVTSGYGMREGGFHGGWDIGTYTGTKLFSPFDGGIVKRVRLHSPDAGNYIAVYYPERNLLVRFLHLHNIAPKIDVGSEVNRLTVLGQTGASGPAGMKAHLHLDITPGKEFDGQANCTSPENIEGIGK